MTNVAQMGILSFIIQANKRDFMIHSIVTMSTKRVASYE